MEEQKHPHHGAGKRLEQQDSWWTRYRDWVSGLSRGQKIRYRILQTATIISAIIVLLWAGYNLWVRPPELPTPPKPSTSTGTSDPTKDPTLPDDPDEPAITLPGAEALASLGGQREGVYTFLLVGKDTAGGGNTDTMILVTYDTVNKTVDAMSLPRDTIVNVSWNTKKLNTVYNYYKGRDTATQVEKGMTALKEHVRKLTGIQPNYYVIVEWDAVGELVEALGGVTFDVPYDMNYDDPTPGQDLHIHQEKGLRRLSGDDAMQVIRWRKNNGVYGDFGVGDAGRMQIQQDFLMAVARECLQLKNLLKAPEFARIFTENVTTDLTIGNLIWFGQQAIGMDAENDVHFHTLPYTGYNRYFSYYSFTSYVLPLADEVLELVNASMNPYQRDIQKSDLELLCLNSDGSFTVTSGTLADPDLGKAGYKQSSYPKPTPQEPASQQPDSQEPSSTDPDAQQPSAEPETPPQQENPGGQTPDAPEQPSSVVQKEETQGSGNTAANVLPARPVPVQ